MLVLTRRVGESVLIGNNIEITLVRIDGDQVRIGVSAPRDIPVQRKELAEAIRQENLNAAETARQALQVSLDDVQKPQSPNNPHEQPVVRRKA